MAAEPADDSGRKECPAKPAKRVPHAYFGARGDTVTRLAVSTVCRMCKLINFEFSSPAASHEITANEDHPKYLRFALTAPPYLVRY